MRGGRKHRLLNFASGPGVGCVRKMWRGAAARNWIMPPHAGRTTEGKRFRRQEPAAMKGMRAMLECPRGDRRT